MSKGTVNKVILVGRLGADPEVRYMPSGNAVANLRLATNDGYKDKQTGQFVENTEWHKVAMFGRLAEIAGQYLQKGRSVYIEGRIRTNKWQDQSGQDRYTTEIVANEMQLLGGGGPGSSNNNQGGGFSNQNFSNQGPQQQNQPASGAAAQKPEAPAPNLQNFESFDDDEIPF